MNDRYTWQAKVAPSRHELIDRVSSKAVAIVVFDGESQIWEWTRFTTKYLHGAPPVCGSTKFGLRDAKSQVLDGLIDGAAPSEIK